MAKSETTEVETAPDFDRNWHRARIALQVLLALVLGAGLAGLFGGGVLSTRVVKIGPLEVTYERFVRRNAPFRISMRTVDPIHTGTLDIGIDQELIDHAGILRTVPVAASRSEASRETDFHFAIAAQPAEIVISVQPDRFGIFNWTLKVVGIGEASLFQIIYP